MLGSEGNLRGVNRHRYTRVHLAERCHQLAETSIFRQVGWSESAENHSLVSFCIIPCGTEQTVGENAAQRRLKLVVVRVDESRHHDHPGCIHD